jgi:hypothetical protein
VTQQTNSLLSRCTNVTHLVYVPFPHSFTYVLCRPTAVGYRWTAISLAVCAALHSKTPAHPRANRPPMAGEWVRVCACVHESKDAGGAAQGIRGAVAMSAAARPPVAGALKTGAPTAPKAGATAPPAKKTSGGAAGSTASAASAATRKPSAPPPKGGAAAPKVREHTYQTQTHNTHCRRNDRAERVDMWRVLICSMDNYNPASLSLCSTQFAYKFVISTLFVLPIIACLPQHHHVLIHCRHAKGRATRRASRGHSPGAHEVCVRPARGRSVYVAGNICNVCVHRTIMLVSRSTFIPSAGS